MVSSAHRACMISYYVLKCLWYVRPYVAGKHLVEVVWSA